MYAQGLTAIVLCEDYAMSGDSSLKKPAQRALDYICSAQHPAGGWRYFPGQPGDMTVTGWQLMALKSGQMAKLEVPSPVIERARKFLDTMQAYGGLGRKPANERFAESFAMSFLMPASSVRFRFNEIVNRTGNFKVGDLVKLKHFYYVSMEAMALRLEALGLLKQGTWELQKEKSLPICDAEKRLGLVVDSSPEPAYPERYKFLAVHAYERGELSEKEVANYLRCDIWEARQVIREAKSIIEVDAEGRTLPMQADFETSLLVDCLLYTSPSPRD